MNDKDMVKNKSRDVSVIDDETRISAPIKFEQILSIKFNQELNMYEGLPKAWRELLEISPQSQEIEDIDESLKFKKGTVLP